MADFITRLAERALGVAPVVQPVMPPMFAPEPASHSTGLEWDSEATTSPGDPDRPRAPSAQETPPTRDAPTGRPADAATAQQEDQSGDALSSATPGSPRGTPESRSGASHLNKSGSSERGAMTGKEDQRGPSRTTARHPQTPPETRPETLHRAEPGPTRRGSPLGLPSAEDGSGEAVFRPLRTLLDRGQGETLPSVPSPGAQASLDSSEDTLESKTSLDRPEPPDAPPPVAPRMVRPQLDGHLERGPQEPRVAAPESSAPAIRVTIGRIEVRAITPPPRPPAQRTAPARPGPELSLDDYLKQHNGRQR
jgi:hypothetical protein